MAVTKVVGDALQLMEIATRGKTAPYDYDPPTFRSTESGDSSFWDDTARLVVAAPQADASFINGNMAHVTTTYNAAIDKAVQKCLADMRLKSRRFASTTAVCVESLKLNNGGVASAFPTMIEVRPLVAVVEQLYSSVSLSAWMFRGIRCILICLTGHIEIVAITSEQSSRFGRTSDSYWQRNSR